MKIVIFYVFLLSIFIVKCIKNNLRDKNSSKYFQDSPFDLRIPSENEIQSRYANSVPAPLNMPMYSPTPSDEYRPMNPIDIHSNVNYNQYNQQPIQLPYATQVNTFSPVISSIKINDNGNEFIPNRETNYNSYSMPVFENFFQNSGINQKRESFDYNYVSNYQDHSNQINDLNEPQSQSQLQSQSQSLEQNLVSSTGQEEVIEGDQIKGLEQSYVPSVSSQSPDEKFMKKFKKVIKKMNKIKDETKSLKKDLKDQKEQNQILVEKIKSDDKNDSTSLKDKKKNIKSKEEKDKENESSKNKNKNSEKNNNFKSKSAESADSSLKTNFISEWIKKFSSQGMLRINESLVTKFDESSVYSSISSNKLKFTAKNAISKDTYLIKIDKKLILTTKSDISEKICDKIKYIPELSNNYDKICLSVVLLSQESENENDLQKQNLKNSSTKFLNVNIKPHSYLNKNYLLSKSYEHFPIFYKDKTLKIAKGTLFNSLIQSRQELFEKEYSLLSEKKIIKKSDVEMKEYFKARSYVISKNFLLQNKAAIIPLLDQVNILHQKDNKVSNFKIQNSQNLNSSNIFMYFNSTRKIEKGEELILKSGAMSNENLLLYYGYTIKNNKMKSNFFIDIKINSKLNSTLSTEYESIHLRYDYDLNKTLNNFRKLISGQDSTIYNLDFETESQAVNILKKSLKAQLAKYPSNYKSDEIILQNQKNLTENEINLYRVVIEEKRRVNAYFNLVAFFNKIFKLVWNNKTVSDKLLRKIAVTKAYRKYYNCIKEVFLQKKNILVIDKPEEKINFKSNINFTNSSISSVSSSSSLQNKNNSSLSISDNKHVSSGNFTSSSGKAPNLRKSDEEEEEDDEVEDELESEDDFQSSDDE